LRDPSDILSIMADEATRRFSKIRPVRSPPTRQEKIAHFVVLLMENRAFDNVLGCLDKPGIDGIPPAGHTVPIDPSDPSKGVVNISCGHGEFMCDAAPSYDTFAPKFPKDGTSNPHSYPYSPQSDSYSGYSLADGAHTRTAVRAFSPAQMPVKAAIAEHFGVFNRLFSAVPSPSIPNHLFIQSGTSCGVPANGGDDSYLQCGGKSKVYPQLTIYDSLRLHNVSFGLFMNSTCGLDGKPCTGEGMARVNVPDILMAGVARHKDRYFSQEAFYSRAANGSLPSFSWLMPPFEACDHPCYDVRKGDRYIKDIYEALRAGPAWNQTMLLVVYDDAGGLYDHVVPPSEGVPADGSPCTLIGPPDFQCSGPITEHRFPAFDFRRLGLRTTAMLISPWVAKGAVFQEPKAGPTPTSQFELSSVPATLKNLFNLSAFLTKRDAWAGSFDEVLLSKPRTDAPMHLPEALPPRNPWKPPPGVLDSLEMDDDGDDDGDGDGDGDGDNDPWRSFVWPHVTKGRRRTHTADGAASEAEVAAGVEQHCSSVHGGPEQPCRGLSHVNLKQRRNLRTLSRLTATPEPDIDSMNVDDAARWIAHRWVEWMRQEDET
jgi:phospholipase C